MADEYYAKRCRDACMFEQTIEGERACGKPPVFEKCQYQVTPEEIEWIE